MATQRLCCLVVLFAYSQDSSCLSLTKRINVEGQPPCNMVVGDVEQSEFQTDGNTQFHHTILDAQNALKDTLASRVTKDGATSQADFIICLTSGVHDVSMSTLKLGLEESMTGGKVVWRGSNSAPSVVSGGTQIVDWKSVVVQGQELYVGTIPTAAVGVVRQMWVNGDRASRVVIGEGAADPSNAHCDSDYKSTSHYACPMNYPICIGYDFNHSWGHCVGGGGGSGANSNTTLPYMKGWVSADSTTFGYTATDIPVSWSTRSTTSIEFTWPIIVRNWIEPRCTVASIVGNNITLATPCGAHLCKRSKCTVLPPPVFVEAAPSFPLGQGVFFHDVEQHSIFYNAAPGVTLSDLQADAWISVQEVLVDHVNATGQVWENVQFSYATWYQANSNDGFVDQQTAVFACTTGTPSCNMGTSGEPLGAVRVTGSQRVEYHNCTFRHLGSPYGLSVMGSSQYVTVDGSTFDDLSGGFLKLGSVDASKFGGSNNIDDWDSYFSITHNTASNQAEEYGGAAGFFGGYIFSADISHNTVSDAGYSGFSLGWGWGESYPPGYGNNSISYNKIFNVMTKLKDGGGIYVNGATNGSYTSVMSYNWVNNDEHVYAVFYLDNGASHWHVTQNFASNSTIAWAYFMTGGPGPKPLAAQNNQLDHFWYESDAAPVNNCAKYNCVVDQTTVYKIVPPLPLPQGALAIMSGAGANPGVYTN